MANEHFSRKPTSEGNRKVWTWSAWLKQSNSVGDGTDALFSARSGNQQSHIFIQHGTGNLQFYSEDSGGTTRANIKSIIDVNDVSGWYHILLSFNCVDTDGNSGVDFYVNGVLAPRDTSEGTALQDVVHNFNTTSLYHTIGRESTQSAYYEGSLFDVYFVDGTALTPDVFGFYKEGKGYISAGSTQATDFKPGQWVPKSPRTVKSEINRRNGFGVNGYYLPMNDSANFGADFHCTPNSIISLQEDLAQPKVSIASTAQAGLAYTDVLRADPYAANLVLAVPFVNGGLGTDGTSSGINTGFGDYSHIIRGSGTPKVGIISATSDISIANVAVGETAGVYYGSGAKFPGTSYALMTYENNSDFQLGGGDFTLESWVFVQKDNFPILYLWDNGSQKSYNLHMGNGSGASGECPTFGWSFDGSSATYIEAPNSSAVRHQWHHIAAERYGNTISLYLNGTVCGVKTDQTGSFHNSTVDVIVGQNQSGTSSNEGYLQDLRLYKGVAKYKGGFEVPKPYTPVGIATWRNAPESTKNSFNNLSRISERAADTGTLVDGALKYSGVLNERNIISSNIGVSTGKWYFETRIGDKGHLSDNHAIMISNRAANANGNHISGSILNNNNGTSSIVGISNDGTGALRLYGSFGNITIESGWWADGMIVGFAFDVAGDSISIYKNGSLTTTRSIDLSYVNSTTTGIGTTVGSTAWMPALEFESSASRTPASNWIMNFGQNPSFGGNETAGTYTDANGRGLFKYEPPSGYLSMCLENLDAPTIANPGEHFKTVLYKGNSTDQNTSPYRDITGVGFTPGLVWIKSRTNTADHRLTDDVRGPMVSLRANSSGGEQIESNGVAAFTADGFNLGPNFGYNDGRSGAQDYVAWCWKAGAGTTSTNTDGDINSIVSVNQEGGFSVVSWEHDGGTNPRQIGHGLGKAPAMIILKHRNAASSWRVYHRALDFPATTNVHLEDNSTGAQTETDFGDTLPTSTVFSTSTTGVTGRKVVAYCWTEIEGYSKFGTYTGNGSNNGAFVYCGFKPALIIIRRIHGGGNWQMYDNARNPINPARRNLMANTTSVGGETVVSANGYDIDFYANGFKVRSTDTDRNAENQIYIFAAWAESPLATANAK